MPVFSLLLQAAEQEAPRGPFAITPGVSLWTLVIFLILMAVLAKTVWPMILKAVDEREARIKGQIEAAERANADAQRLLEQYQAQLAKANAEAQEIVAQGRQAGDELREQLATKGRQEQEELLQRARREINLERDRAVAELRREAVELSIAAASKVIEKNLDTESDRKLVRDYLDSLHPAKS